MAELEPGWLMRTAHAAHIRTMLDHNPVQIKNIYETPLPIPHSEAGELYEKMDARFKAWTGMSLAQWQGERP